MATLNVADKTTLDAVYNKIGSMSGSFVPPLTSSTSTNPTTTYLTASANAVAGSTLDFTFSGAKNIHAIVFVPGNSSYGSGNNYGSFDKVILTIDGTTIELNIDPQKISTNGYEDNLLAWMGQATYRAKLVNTWNDEFNHAAVMPIQVKCNSSVKISLNCTTDADLKLRCKILYTPIK